MISLVEAVTPSNMFNSEVLAVIPSNTLTSLAVAVTSDILLSVRDGISLACKSSPDVTKPLLSYVILHLVAPDMAVFELTNVLSASVFV